MKLTKTERLFLINQFEVLKSLQLEDAGEYENKIKILQEGYTYFYDDIFGFLNDDLPESISEEVILILNMYRAINFSYDQLNDEQREGIPQHRIAFEGFDGNEEYAHYAFAKFVINELAQYEELKNHRGYNTHRNVLPKYRRMLAEWESLGNPGVLDKDDLLKLFMPQNS